MAEHQQRVSTATSALTLGDLRALVSDLQSGSAVLQPPPVTRAPRLATPNGWALLAIAFVASVLLGMGSVGGCTATPSRRSTSRPIPAPNPTGWERWR